MSDAPRASSPITNNARRTQGDTPKHLCGIHQECAFHLLDRLFPRAEQSGINVKMSSKRHSMLPAVSNTGPRPPVNFSSSLTVADSAILVGRHSITIQSESVLHPRSKLESTNGSILIGRRCIVHERAHIGAVGDEGASGSIALGDYVTVEVGAVIETGGTEIGTDTVVGVRSRIGHGAIIGKVGSMLLATSSDADRHRTAQYHL